MCVCVRERAREGARGREREREGERGREKEREKERKKESFKSLNLIFEEKISFTTLKGSFVTQLCKKNLQ